MANKNNLHTSFIKEEISLYNLYDVKIVLKSSY